MRASRLAALLLTAVVFSPNPGVSKPQGKGETITGYLIDVACGTEKGADAKTAAKHDTSCLVMDDCAKSGYGIMTADSRYYRFDAAGNGQARKLIASTKKEADWRITVVGTIEKDTIKVQAITVDK